MMVAMLIAVAGLLIWGLLCTSRIIMWYTFDRVPPEPGRALMFWASLGILLPGLFVGFGELVLPLFIMFWCVVWTCRLSPRWTAGLPASFLLAFIIAHLQGHVLYGSPRITDNRPLLHQPLEIAKLEAPNMVVASDGSRHPVAGVEFKPEFLALPPEEQRWMMDRFDKPLRFSPDTTRPRGYVAEHRIRYFCGNSFFPSFLPKNLPKYRTEDLAVTLDWLVVNPPK